MNVNIYTKKEIEDLICVSIHNYMEGYNRKLTNKNLIKPLPIQMVKPEDSISILNVSVRTSNCLFNSNITTFKQLCSLSPQELFRFRNFGRTSLLEVEIALARVGMKLEMIFK